MPSGRGSSSSSSVLAETIRSGTGPVAIVLAEPDSPAARALAHITSEVEAKVGGKKVRLPILTG